ncbi:TetR/AcrR family transcriptional regulator [Kribbella sp. NBC_01245]|uniref:TetR/AcrR family transcriptional regulator n=1 Tax=Kribbella sp. NBC_01245 TaxID=2903578 RepID=UPI002E2E7694|nr:TetR/AcrR family transcriptional regulator [Kribbella sp. NBC_01245]
MTDRTPYHHGDLRNALVGAAAELAEQGGPDAVTVRAAARIAGVTPTAAYRHFSGHEDLLLAAKERSLASMETAMRKRLARLPDAPDPAQAAVNRLEAIGRGYVDFALSEPGLFRTAFCSDPAKQSDPQQSDPKQSGAQDFGPPGGAHGMLRSGIDELLALDFFRPDQRDGVEVAAWALVHGLSFLLLDGPFSRLPAKAKAHMLDQALDAFLSSLWNSRKSLLDG